MHLRYPLSEVGGVIRRLELFLAPDRCDEVYCDDTGLRPVLRGRFFQVREGKTCLFHGQAGESSPRCSLSKAL